jgi:glycosyltransferase involved in cell wall biosynthesis
VTLIVVGDGEERHSLERLAHKLKISHRVQFRGWVDRRRVLELVSQAAAVVFTGLREEGGLALAEAMLLGVPVVVLGNGGARTVAASGTDPSRVAIIPPTTVAATARRIGEAMTEFCHSSRTQRGTMLDQARAREALRDAFNEALDGRTA